jgi:hypothetical protein
MFEAGTRRAILEKFSQLVKRHRLVGDKLVAESQPA